MNVCVYVFHPDMKECSDEMNGRVVLILLDLTFAPIGMYQLLQNRR